MSRRFVLLVLAWAGCATPGPSAEPPAVDRHGVPLPQGASTRLGSSRFRYGSQVHSLDLSPDGKTVVTAGSTAWVDGSEIRLWEAATGKLVRSHDLRWCYRAAVTPDGKGLVACGSGYNSVNRWDFATGELLWEERQGQNFCASALCVSPDSRTVAIGYDSLRLLDGATGKLVREIARRPGSNSLHSIAFSPDGTLLAAEDHYEASLWEVGTGRLVRRMEGKLCVEQVAFTPDGTQLIATPGAKGDVLVWDVATGRQTRTLPGHVGATGTLAISKDGRLVATGGGSSAASNLRDGPDHSIKIWELKTGKLLRGLPGHGGTPTGLAFTADSATLVTADMTVRFWDVATGRQLRPEPAHDDAISDLQFADDATVVTAATDGTVRTWDARTGEQLRVDRLIPERVEQIILGPGGRRVGAVLPGGEAVATEVANGAEVGRFKMPGQHGTAKFAPDGGGLILLGLRAITRAEFGGATTTWQLPSEWRGAPVTDPECRYAAEVRSGPRNPADWGLGGGGIGNGGPKPPFDLVLWDLVRGAEHRRIRLPDDIRNDYPIFAPNGRGVCIGVEQWEVSTGRRIGSFGAWTTAGAFSPDGLNYAVAGSGSVALWEIATQKRLFSHPLGVDGASCVRWSPDGRRLAAATGTTALIWDVPAKAK